MSSPAGLLSGPTPMDRADRLGDAIGLAPGRLWIKRDDLTPLAGGGNKVRKLDHLCAAALAAGADVLVTGGGAQSNHVRLTAAAGRRLGLDVVAVFAGEAPAAASGNIVIDALLDITMIWTGKTRLAEVEAEIAAAGERLAASGRRPYVIPVGGADQVGSQGYVVAAAELELQVPGFDLVVVPAGSGGTHAGLAAGLGDHDRVLGVNVGAFEDVAVRIARLTDQTAAFAGRPNPSGSVRVDERYTAAGYGAELPDARTAMRLAARTEGLILDPVYTGKALAALMAGIAERSIAVDTRIIFVHCGGTYGLLSDRYSNWIADWTSS
ncbi:pyridoxal-phosphate dependent enzyme [Dactylosporangium sp. NPDC049525]|uniref:1-aminocyclopropane-1-carboxylate deaminase/D-cysteine desulfhydrase n=1 Tax=Dactylosporangium sp. NPDC049525 TaxID=3154730 RepID=UPI00341B5406